VWLRQQLKYAQKVCNWGTISSHYCTQLAKKCCVFCGTPKFTGSHYWSMSWDWRVQCTLFDQNSKFYFNIILPFIPRSSEWFLSRGCLAKILCTLLTLPHLISVSSFDDIYWRLRILQLLIKRFSPHSCHGTAYRCKYFSYAPCSQAPPPCGPPLYVRDGISHPREASYCRRMACAPLCLFSFKHITVDAPRRNLFTFHYSAL
jgi:hypothetical protein